MNSDAPPHLLSMHRDTSYGFATSHVPVRRHQRIAIAKEHMVPYLVHLIPIGGNHRKPAVAE